MIDFKKIDCFLLDLDGTIYLGGKLIDGAREALERMRRQGKVYFITNNSSVTASDYVNKLCKMGIAATLDNFYTSTCATIDFLNENHANKSVYLVATPPVRDEFLRRGIRLSDNAEIVVLTFDKTLDYQKICHADKLLRQGALYFATHPDVTCPTEHGDLPDIGAFMKLFKESCGRLPSVVCGKPFAPMANGVLRRTGADPSRTVMIGDRLYTDIKFALNNGFKAALVLSGETTKKMYNESGLKAHAVLSSIKEILA